MATVNVVFGSTTGETERYANIIAEALGVTAVAVGDADLDTYGADVLLLGSSTWGYGDLQDDWAAGIDLLDAVDLAGKKVGLFGCGDSIGFADTFANALGTLADKVTERGGTLIGAIEPPAAYPTESMACRDGKFIGLALDSTNEADLADELTAAWIDQIKAEAGL